MLWLIQSNVCSDANKKTHNFSLPTSFSSSLKSLKEFFVHLPLHAILINVVASSATELTFQHPILIYFMVKKPIFEA